MSAAPRMSSAAPTSARVCPLCSLSRTVSLSDSTADTTNAQPRARSSGNRPRYFRMCSILIVASKVTSGNSSCSARTIRSECVGPLRKSGSPNVMCRAPARTCWRTSARTVSRATARRDRAVQARVQAAACGLDVSSERQCLTVAQPGVAIQRRQTTPVGHEPRRLAQQGTRHMLARAHAGHGAGAPLLHRANERHERRLIVAADHGVRALPQQIVGVQPRV